MHMVYLEGDGELVLQRYEVISTLTTAVSMTNPHYPNLQAVARQMSGGDTNTQQQMIQYGKECVQPAIEYFKAYLSGPLKIALSAFKAARLFVPHKVTEMKPDSSDIDSLTAFPFLSSQEILSALKTELPQYSAQADGTSSDYSPLEFWKR